MQLTKDTDKILSFIYDEYLNRRQLDMSKSEAKSFNHPSALQRQFLQGILEDDISDALLELNRNGLIHMYYDRSFQLEDAAIIYMENRFKNKVSEVIDTISKLKP